MKMEYISSMTQKFMNLFATQNRVNGRQILKEEVLLDQDGLLSCTFPANLLMTFALIVVRIQLGCYVCSIKNFQA
jgi:hypothetical protein